MEISKGVRTAAVVIATVLGASGAAAAANVPDAWAWQHRLLVVFAVDGEDPALAEQRRNLARFEAELLDRDMAVVEVLAGRTRAIIGPDLQLTGSALSAYAGRNGDAFEVVLFGKDTGLKLRSGIPVTANELFSLIDAMPMRRQEM